MIIDVKAYLSILESYLEVRKQMSQMSWKLVYNTLKEWKYFLKSMKTLVKV